MQKLYISFHDPYNASTLTILKKFINFNECIRAIDYNHRSNFNVANPDLFNLFILSSFVILNSFNSEYYCLSDQAQKTLNILKSKHQILQTKNYILCRISFL
ncbi:hypothetical protein H311_04077 [Anncaliia algerae PRA109]|nr:hypothetical protein H311_04077 [Anncaliia algerae PRA109]